MTPRISLPSPTALRRALMPLALTLGLLASCQRVYEPLTRQQPDEPPAQGLELSQAELRQHISDYLKGLQFALARQELELITDRHTQDSLRSVLERAEAFADAHLIYAIDEQQRKTYLGGKERINYYLKHGHLSSMEDPTALNFVMASRDSQQDFSSGIALPETMTQLYNLARYSTLTELHLTAGSLERLDLRGLSQLRSLELRHAKDGLEVDLSESPHLQELRLKNTPNLRLRLAPQARPRIIVQGGYYSSLSGLQVEQASSLILEGIRLRDVELLGKVSPQLRRLDITIEDGDQRGADGILYHPLRFDKAFVTKLSEQLPQLEQLNILVTAREALERASLQELRLPALRRLSLQLRPKTTYTPEKDWGKRFALSLPHCPQLEELTLGALYYKEVDLSGLREQTQPRLKSLLCYGALSSLRTPSLGHRYDLRLHLDHVDQIQVPEAGRLQAELALYNYTSRNEDGSPAASYEHGLLPLDGQQLFRDFRSVVGYVLPLVPSRYQPRGDESLLRFSGSVWDFSGSQWEGFKGLISTRAVSSYNALPLDYLDFGKLSASCFVEKSITVRPGCIVKNVPEGIRVVEEEIKNY